MCAPKQDDYSKRLSCVCFHLYWRNLRIFAKVYVSSTAAGVDLSSPFDNMLFYSASRACSAQATFFWCSRPPTLSVSADRLYVSQFRHLLALPVMVQVPIPDEDAHTPDGSTARALPALAGLAARLGPSLAKALPTLAKGSKLTNVRCTLEDGDTLSVSPCCVSDRRKGHNRLCEVYKQNGSLHPRSVVSGRGCLSVVRRE